MTATHAAALDQFKKQAHGHGRENEKSLLYFGYEFFSLWLVQFREIIKTVATRCHILKLKCTEFDFGSGSAPDPAGEAYSAPPDPIG